MGDGDQMGDEVTATSRPASRVPATGFGLLMVAAADVGACGPAAIAAALAVIAVLAGLYFRPAATLAVLLSMSAIALTGSPPGFAALSGLSATAYLVLRHAAGAPAAVTVTAPTVIGALVFTFAGIVATSLRLPWPWLPLTAPPAVLGIYLLATRPFLGDRSWWPTHPILGE
jgi:hypothetical protein